LSANRRSGFFSLSFNCDGLSLRRALFSVANSLSTALSLAALVWSSADSQPRPASITSTVTSSADSASNNNKSEYSCSAIAARPH